jgi:hypothetical protein
MASNLAPVYLDDARVTLQGDPRPQVSKILQAGGHPAGQGVVVVRLREAAGADGHPIALDDVIDREKAITPVYLRVLTGAAKTGPAGGPSAKAPGDIARGTEAISPSPTASGEATARKGASQRFAESQSFADPAHKGGSPRQAQGSRPSREVPAGHQAEGGIRTQETASEEGAGPLRSPQRTTTTTSRGALEKASEEE